MASKVVHLSDEAHAKAKAYCANRGIRMSDWITGLIMKLIESSTDEVVQGKPVPNFGSRDNHEDVAGREPFWDSGKAS